MNSNTIQQFRSVLSKIACKEELTISSSVNSSIHSCIHNLMKEESANLIELVEAIEREVAETMSSGSFSSFDQLKRSSITKFHKFRTYKLPELLTCLSSLPCMDNIFVWQMVAEEYFHLNLQAPSKLTCKKERNFDVVEKNAVRYAAGFVLRKLKRKFGLRKDCLPCIDCLQQMMYDPTDLDFDQQEDDPALAFDDFEEYTKVWLKKTDRGGLLHVTEEAFWLFCEIEREVNENLTQSFNGERLSVGDLTSKTCQNQTIRCIWALINVIEDKDMAQHLLESIIEEWVVLRGHSLCSYFLEVFKKANKETKNKKSLRKELKRASNSTVKD